MPAMKPPLPPDEEGRLDALRRYNILDTLPEADFDDLADLAAQLCGTPMALISLVDRSRQWFKARIGIAQDQTPREVSFCGHAIASQDLFVVQDASEDPRFEDIPLVTESPNVRFYAGAPLVTPDGYSIGTLCVLDSKPRWLSDEQREALMALARQTIAQLELRRNLAELEETLAREHATEATNTAVLAHLGEGVLTTDASGIVLSINKALEEFGGWTADEVAGKHFDEAYPLVDHRGKVVPPSDRILSRALQTGEALSTRGYNLSLVRKDGSLMAVGIVAAPVFDSGGNLVAGVEALRDVTPEQEVDRAKSSLISTVSHELRTPLTMIQGFSELLLDRVPLEASAKTAAEQIHSSSQRLARLIEDLLSVARIESGRLVVRGGQVDPAEVLEEVAQSFAVARQVLAEANGALPKVLADRDLLVQILTNLISNAIKYSPPDAPVVAGAAPVDHGVEFRVTDAGIGLTPEDAARIFDRFYRVDSTEVRRVGGTGLGLYITKSLVEVQGGEIHVKSEGPGKGSTFSFTLPAAQ